MRETGCIPTRMPRTRTRKAGMASWQGTASSPRVDATRDVVVSSPCGHGWMGVEAIGIEAGLHVVLCHRDSLGHTITSDSGDERHQDSSRPWSSTDAVSLGVGALGEHDLKNRLTPATSGRERWRPKERQARAEGVAQGSTGFNVNYSVLAVSMTLVVVLANNPLQ